MNPFTSLSIHFTPLVPEQWVITCAAIAGALLIIAALRRNKGFILRGICAAIFIVALIGPSLIREEREPVKDVAAIVLDQSPSQNIGARKDAAANALAALKSKLSNFANLDVRIVESDNDPLASQTKLFEPLDRALADISTGRRAGVIFLSDGQIHDAPKNISPNDYGPIHTLLTGKKDEKDRQLKIIQAPAYGIVGKNVTLKYKIEDTDNIGETNATVILDTHDGAPQTASVPIGEEQSVDLPITHAGQNIFELRVDGVDGELTLANNRAALAVNGVRDRLRVVLISGQPYTGARTWRDLLTSDPAIDLVHFTILREPEKFDATPQNELALIAFPFDELFEKKLYDFDLIIFDRYRANRILPQNYFTNIANYVQKGGALLVTGGPEFTSDESIFYTSLRDVLPAAPSDDMIEKPFTPTLTDDGKKHPVTKDLPIPAGPWLRQATLQLQPDAQTSEILMNGADDKPLLILNRVGEGRVAQLASDQIWLWARGYEGGGPHAELLRRTIHWLMKEPELDEKALQIKTDKGEITIASQDYKQPNAPITVTHPDGTQETITLENSQKTIKADQLGVYAFQTADGQKQFAVMGDLNPPELSGVKTTPDIMAPLAKETGGGVLWLSDTPQPDVRLYNKNAGAYAGNDWIALRSNNDYTVKGVNDTPLLPPWLAAIILIGAATIAWLREGR